jgi:hypothetical protein
MNRGAFERAAVRATSWDDGGIAGYTITGLVTPSSAPLVLADCQDRVGAWGSSGLVASYADAALSIDADALLASALQVVAHGGHLALPTALVVRPDDLVMWNTYADLIARHGILRGVFVDPHAARRWVTLQAQVLQADRLRRNPASAR